MRNRPGYAPVVCNKHRGRVPKRMQNPVNQTYPFEFGGREDDPVIYDKLKELTDKMQPSHLGQPWRCPAFR